MHGGAGAGACAPVDWGSGPKTVFDGAGGAVTGIRSGQQECFDRWARSWEGTTDLGLGVRARLPFRVFTLPDRIVVDVAHQW